MTFLPQQGASRLVFIVAVNVAVSVLLIVILEGAMSWAAFVRAFLREGGVAENRHTKYDPVVGWVNRPGVTVKDIYGPGKNMTILSDGTRLAVRGQDANPRIVCSGDSLTLGYGVDDFDAWCARLSSFGWHGINMAQGGYGLDQSYLWYKVSATNTPHAVHLMAFFTGDLYRVFFPDFLGYAKPSLKVVDGKLLEPEGSLPSPNRLKRFSKIHQKSLEKLAIVRFSKALRRKTAHEPEFLGPDQKPLLTAILKASYDLTRERGARLVVVLLPTLDDYYDQSHYEMMRVFIEEVGKEVGFPVIDVGSTLFAVDKNNIGDYFLAEGAVPYFGATGHYSETGNAHVAEAVGAALDGICGKRSEGIDGCPEH